MANTLPTGDVAVKPSEVKPKLPAMYKVLLINDDYTPMEFVVETIQRFFNKSIEQATQIMLQVHKGHGSLWSLSTGHRGNKKESSDKLCKGFTTSFAM